MRRLQLQVRPEWAFSRERHGRDQDPGSDHVGTADIAADRMSPLPEMARVTGTARSISSPRAVLAVRRHPHPVRSRHPRAGR